MDADTAIAGAGWGVALLLWCLRKKKPAVRVDTEPCPYNLCGTRIVDGGKLNGDGEVVPEECPGCGGWVIWSKGRCKYLRAEAPKG